MPSFVIAEKCDGCKGGDKTACMYICPNDLMVLDPNAMKAYNQEPDQCWECFSCVKICPTQAIEVRGYSDFVPLGSSIMPMMGTEVSVYLWSDDDEAGRAALESVFQEQERRLRCSHPCDSSDQGHSAEDQANHCDSQK